MLTSAVKSVSLNSNFHLFTWVKAAELKGSTIRPACPNAEMHGVSFFNRVNVEVGSILDGRIYIRRNPFAPQ